MLEIDQAVLDINRDQLGLHTGADLKVDIGDARIGIRARPDNSADLVVSDAFGSLSVPWHLTTTEFIDEVQRVLRPDGVYVLNVIDYPPLRFVRAELRTLQEHFRYVGAIAPASVFDGDFGGNVVLVASDRPLDDAALGDLVTKNGNVLLTGDALDRLDRRRAGHHRRLRTHRPVAVPGPELTVTDEERGATLHRTQPTR